MKRTLLTLALVVVAGSAGAQSATAPATGSADPPGMANAPAQQIGRAAATAQRRIEQDGYKNVQNLAKGEDGLWHGTAMRGGTKVQVTVGRSGNVTTTP